MKIKRPRGTRDFSPEEMGKRNAIAKRMRRVFENYNYREILTPVFERSSLFKLRSGGEIQKHMYVFRDKKGRELCLRPEATASVCRMFAEELRTYQKPVKVYYFCPMFRYEEPQKGRYREFWHLGMELIGPDSGESDAEVIALAVESLRAINLEFQLGIGHLGIIRNLMEELGIKEKQQNQIISAIDRGDEKALKKLKPDSVLMKIISLKGNRKVLRKAESMLQKYPKAMKALKELEEILSWLDLLQVDSGIDLGIARGLEYYTGMVFEIRVKNLGAQNQICGGGRYDSLIELFSGLKVPAVGFAFGFDRVVEALEEQGIEFPSERVDLVIAPVNKDVRKDAFQIASQLRKSYRVEVDLMGRKLSKILEYADAINARFVAIIGPREIEEGEITLRDMETGEQHAVEMERIPEFLR